MRAFSILLLFLAVSPGVSFNARLGLLVSLHQADGMELTFDWMQVAACGLLAVDHINNRVDDVVASASRLPANFSVSVFMEDSFSLGSEAANHANKLSTVQGVDVIVGPARSQEAIPAAIVAAAHDVPLVSYLASSPALSDKINYPLFSRTSLEDTLRAKVTVNTCIEMGWKKIAIIYTFDMWGSNFVGLLSEQAEELGMDVAMTRHFNKEDTASIYNAMADLGQSGARIFLFVAALGDLEDIALAAEQEGIIGPGKVWINVGGVEDPGDEVRKSRSPARLQALAAGFLEVRDAPLYGPRSRRFEDSFRAAPPSAVSHPALGDLQRDPRVGPYPHICAHVYDATWAAAFAISGAAEAAREQGGGKGRHALGLEGERRLDGADLATRLRATEFEGAGGPVAFDRATGDRIATGATFVVRSWVPQTTAEGELDLAATVVAVQHVGEGLQRVGDPFWPGGSREWAEAPGDGLCAPGYSPDAESGECGACPAGTESPRGEGCVPCPRGHYGPEEARAHCLPCQTQGFADETGLTRCHPCPGFRQIPHERAHEVGGEELCECPPGYVNACRWAVWHLAAGAAGVAVAGGLGLVVWCLRGDGGRRWEERLVRSELAATRKELRIRREDGFLMPGEWRGVRELLGLGGRTSVVLPGRLVLSAVRLRLWLSFEPLQLDMLALWFKFLFMEGAHVEEGEEEDWSVDARVREKLFRVEEGSRASAGSHPGGAKGLEQYRALGQMVLEISRKLLEPAEGAEQRQARGAGTESGQSGELSVEAVEAARPRSAEERLAYWEARVSVLRLWGDDLNAKLLQHMLRSSLSAFHAACDTRSRLLLAAPAGPALRAFPHLAPQAPCPLALPRQDDPCVAAIRVDPLAREELALLALRRAAAASHASSSSSLAAASHASSSSSLAAASRAPDALHGEPRPAVPAAPRDCSLGGGPSFRQLLHSLSLHSLSLRSLSLRSGSASSGTSEHGPSPPRSPRPSALLARLCPAHPDAVGEARLAESQKGGAGAGGGAGVVSLFESRRASAFEYASSTLTADPPARASPMAPRTASASAPGRTPLGARGGGQLGGALLHLDSMASTHSGGSESGGRGEGGRRKGERRRESGGLLRRVQSTAAREWGLGAGEGREEARDEGELQAEALFAAQLWQRAALLYEGFHQQVRDAVGRGHAVMAQALEAKNDLLVRAARRASCCTRPLAADILDPLRASIRCNGPLDMLQLAGWFVAEGSAAGLTVLKVANKFAAEDVSDSNGYRDLRLSVLYTGEGGLRIIGEISLHDPTLYALNQHMLRLERILLASLRGTLGTIDAVNTTEAASSLLGANDSFLGHPCPTIPIPESSFATVAT